MGKIVNINIEEIQELYNSGIPIRDIAKHKNVAYSTIRVRLDKNLMRREHLEIREWTKKNGFAMKGKKHSIHTKLKMSKAHIGQPSKLKGINFDEKFGIEKGDIVRKKIGDAQIGSKNTFWAGGITVSKYPKEFNIILKHKIRRRDNFKCVECGWTEKQLNRHLDIHHIDYNKKNNNEDNLISLCHSCHIQTNWDRDDWTNYYLNKIRGVQN